MYRVIATIILTAATIAKVSAAKIEVIDSLDNYITKAIADHYFPGAQIVIGTSEGVIYSQAYGFMDYNNSEKVDSTSLYDLASCTKVLATTLGVMTLIDQNELSLDTCLGDVLELSDTLQFRDLTIAELLYHNSGFLPGVAIGTSLVSTTDEEIPVFARRKTSNNPYLYDTNYYAAKDIIYDSLYISHTQSDDNQIAISRNLYLNKSYHNKLDSMINAAYRPKQRGVHKYSDLNFYLLQKLIETKTAAPLDSLSRKIYNTMHLSNIGFKPTEWSPLEKICPTEYDVLLRRDTIRGIVHDELACIQGGVGGNAGLFASANNVAEICKMFLRNGVDSYGNRIIDSMTINKFTQIKRSSSGSTYGLGFTKIDSNKLPYTPESYGHTGYTGTFLWIDPTKDLYVVLLTNRVYPTRTNKKFDSKYRAQIWEFATRIN
ncbi:MAG: serine hydrolase [Rikenellaceae bacterium]